MIVFLLEEASMGDFLQGHLARLVPEWHEGADYRLVVHEGKKDLEKSIPRKLRGWQGAARFVVVRDNDGADCQVLKQRLANLCSTAGRPDTLIRLVCQELEAWYLGDLNAVAEAYGKPAVAAKNGKSLYRNPDAIGNAAQEMRRLVPEFQKGDGALRLASRMDHRTNRSRSFQILCEAILRLADQTA